MADTHLAAVAASLPGFSVRKASSADEVCEALGEHALGLAYFYCHGRGTPDDARAVLAGLLRAARLVAERAES